jgi:hypothetical protein
MSDVWETLLTLLLLVLFAIGMDGPPIYLLPHHG